MKGYSGKGHCGTKSPAASLLEGKSYKMDGIPKQMGTRSSESKNQPMDHAESKQEHERTEKPY